MPILWRYLISHFLKIASMCVIAFVSILLTMRFDDIAHFATLGASWHSILFFTLYQIPYILPIALPLSCLIASIILFQKLSNSHELTALRASGFSIRDILAPILITAVFLSIANFWIASELATYSHLKTNLLKSELRSINPLLLLNNKHLMRLKGYYFEALGPTRIGENASELILAIPNYHQERLYLMVAQNLKASSKQFIGTGVTFLSAAKSSQEEDFDHVLVENTGESLTNIENFSSFLEKKVWTINNDYLKLSLLLARIKEQKELLGRNDNRNLVKQLRHQLNRSQSEIVKRTSIAIAVFSLTLMGAAFAMNISRNKRMMNLLIIIALTALYLISFFTAKSLEHQRLLSAILFLLPHVLIITASLIYVRRMSRGIE